MAEINKNLVHSMLWNLKEMTNLAERIKSLSGDVECTSWRFPALPSSQIDVLQLLRQPHNSDNYTYVLELIHDRALYIFNLFIKYLEISDAMMKFRPQKNVFRPNSLSLAAVLNMLWDRIQGHAQELDRKSPEKIGDFCKKSSASTQSEMSCLTCFSCDLAQSFVTKLVLDVEKLVEEQGLESAVTEEREAMKDSIFDLSNWSAMTRWLEAVGQDLRKLAAKMESSKAKTRKLKVRLGSEERILKSKTEKLEAQNVDLETHVKELESNKSDLAKKIDQLSREVSRLTGVNSKAEEKRKQSEKDWEKKFEEEKEKASSLRKQSEKIFQMMTNLREESERQKREYEEKEDDNKCLRREIDMLKEENLNVKKDLQEKQNTLDAYVEKMLTTFPDLDGDLKRKYKATGNPLIDMASQMEANAIRMKQLNLQNDNLRKTLDRLTAVGNGVMSSSEGSLSINMSSEGTLST